MTTKTLGQVLYEADAFAFGPPAVPLPYGEMPECDRIEYERIAQAVAAVVREQAIRACCAQIGAFRPRWVDYDCHVHSVDMCVVAIRSMKP